MSVVHAGRRVGHVAAGATGHPFVKLWMRFGYVVRGVIYLLPAVLALKLALVSGSQKSSSLTQGGAIATLGRQPMGHAILIAIAAGLAGYALWGFTRAIFDPLDRGKSPHGVFKRLGYAWSGIVHVGLFIATMKLIGGASSPITSNEDWTAELLSKPLGAWMVGIIGVAWIFGGGLSQVVSGWKGTIQKDLDLAGRSEKERWWAKNLARVGIVSRGLVFTMIGIFLVSAAVHARAEEALGMDGVLLQLLEQPYGRILLGILSIGLIAFGVFSVLCARWMRVRPLESGSPPSGPAPGGVS